MIRQFLVGALLAATLSVGSASADSYTAGQLKIEQPWSRAIPAGATVAAGYVTIINAGAETDRLIAVETTAAARTELHESREVEGRAQMRPLSDGVALAPHSTVTLEPGGFHIMFMDVKVPFEEKVRIPVTLVFEKAGRVDVAFSVKRLGASPKSHSGHDAH